MALASVLLGAGCSSDPEGSGASTSADCSSQIRVDGQAFTGYAFTHAPAARQGVADVAACHDVGKDAEGSVFAEDPDQVRTWAFDGYSPDEVLGVQWRYDAFEVFISESVSADERDRIADELSLSTFGWKVTLPLGW